MVGLGSPKSVWQGKTKRHPHLVKGKKTKSEETKHDLVESYLLPGEGVASQPQWSGQLQGEAERPLRVGGGPHQLGEVGGGSKRQGQGARWAGQRVLRAGTCS
jgi:hypothetical protein